MEDKIYKLLMWLTISLAVLALITFIIHIPQPVPLALLAAFVVMLIVTIMVGVKMNKNVMDFKCAIEDLEKDYKPGDTVSYNAEFTAKASFELIKFSVTIIGSFHGQDLVRTEHKEQKVHLEKKSYTIGNEEKIQGSFILPENPNMYGPRHSYKLIFRAEVKSSLDTEETIEFINNDKSLLLWDNV
jgi:hypothetical protein